MAVPRSEYALVNSYIYVEIWGLLGFCTTPHKRYYAINNPDPSLTLKLILSLTLTLILCTEAFTRCGAKKRVEPKMLTTTPDINPLYATVHTVIGLSHIGHYRGVTIKVASPTSSSPSYHPHHHHHLCILSTTSSQNMITG